MDRDFALEAKVAGSAKSEARVGLHDLVAHIANHDRVRPCVAEVMSPPWVCVEAVALGCVDGGSYDLDTGWNFLETEDQEKCLAQMEKRNVDAVVVTPPCDQFSVLQNLSKDKGDPEVRKSRLRDGLKLLTYVCCACLQVGYLVTL